MQKTRISSSHRAKISLVAFLLIFSTGTSILPASAIDMGERVKYIITFLPSSQSSVDSAVTRNSGEIRSRFNYAFKGYVIELPKRFASVIARMPNVLTIEQDMPVTISDLQNIQSPTPSWGIDRVDQREKVGLPGSNSAYGYSSAGTGSTIYIGDTGFTLTQILQEGSQIQGIPE